jgi:ABC-type glycerol-3-phosphate transport system substrate-binding protein
VKFRRSSRPDASALINEADLKRAKPALVELLGWGFPNEEICPDLRWQKPWAIRYRKQLLQELHSEQTPLCLAIVDCREIPLLAAQGLLKPLDQALPSSTLKSFFSPAVELCSHESKLYGIPEDFAPYVLISRRDVLSEHKLSPPQTWRDLEKQLKILSKTIKGPLIGVPGGGQGAFLGFLLSVLASNGLRAFEHADDLSANEQACVQVYAFIQKLQEQGWLDLHRLKVRSYLARDLKRISLVINGCMFSVQPNISESNHLKY